MMVRPVERAAMTEPDLLDAARRGDADAFARLIEPLTVRLALLIRRVGGHALGADQDDEDLLQVVLTRAWQLLPAFQPQGEGSFHRWLVALARGAVADRRKYVEAKGRGTVRHLESTLQGAARPALPRELSSSISRIASHREEGARAAAALAALPDRYREVVETHLLEARSLREIGAQLGLTANAVWERLHRGLALMRTRLS
jgi:RNA polymerase sigma factor (sigma-70 family)